MRDVVTMHEAERASDSVGGRNAEKNEEAVLLRDATSSNAFVTTVMDDDMRQLSDIGFQTVDDSCNEFSAVSSGLESGRLNLKGVGKVLSFRWSFCGK